MFAVNLGDWCSNKTDICLNVLLSPVCATMKTVVAEPRRVDGTAVLIDCDDDRAEAIAKVIRLKFPVKNLFRVYERKGGRWKRI